MAPQPRRMIMAAFQLRPVGSRIQVFALRSCMHSNTRVSPGNARSHARNLQSARRVPSFLLSLLERVSLGSSRNSGMAFVVYQPYPSRSKLPKERERTEWRKRVKLQLRISGPGQNVSYNVAMQRSCIQFGRGPCSPSGWRNSDAGPVLRIQNTSILNSVFRRKAFPIYPDKNIGYANVVLG